MLLMAQKTKSYGTMIKMKAIFNLMRSRYDLLRTSGLFYDHFCHCFCFVQHIHMLVQHSLLYFMHHRLEQTSLKFIEDISFLVTLTRSM
ncbi:hypothetical protein M513_01930 [Trichuris suis]|uniref:Uncharacterized protein n=1 Tax=Trichuris suis TaxID=68888 RepID=A0A085MIJ9_9BILA|nr:hypothetical protein M513_01930 [Trichuris suis]